MVKKFPTSFLSNHTNKQYINSWIYTDLANCNGAYKAGFTSTQQAYEAAYKKFFQALDRAELLLSQSR